MPTFACIQSAFSGTASPCQPGILVAKAESNSTSIPDRGLSLIPMICPDCNRPMQIKTISEHWCFRCDAMFYGWECPSCGGRKMTGCLHVEAEPFARKMTAEEFKAALRASLEGDA